MTDRPYFDEIDELYRRILQRSVDPSGYATYSRLMARGELSAVGLARILRDSDEFMVLVHQPVQPTRFAISSQLHFRDQRDHAKAPLRSVSGGTVAGTIASKRYIANARVTAKSFRQHHPDIPFVLLLTDEVDGYLDPSEEPFQIWTLGDLDLPDVERFVFPYTDLEASYAATPFFLGQLLASGFERVVFLKQETLVLGVLTDLIDELDRHAFFVTPHLLEPTGSSDAAEDELKILRAGVFNGGIIGASNAPDARSFLAWWKERTYRNCYLRSDAGLHFEQRWLDFLPARVSSTLIVKDPGINVAHWNLLDRRVRAEGGEFTARGEPLRVFRFSGFEPERPDRVSRHSDLDVRDTADAAEVFRKYHSMLVDAGHAETRTWPYAYGSFDNGVPIPDVARRIYRDLNNDGSRFGDPRRTADAAGSFYHWLRSPGRSSGRGVSNLWQAIYDREPIVQLKFPRVEDLSSRKVIAWWRQFGEARYRIPEELCPRPRRSR